MKYSIKIELFCSLMEDILFSSGGSFHRTDAPPLRGVLFPLPSPLCCCGCCCSLSLSLLPSFSSSSPTFREFCDRATPPSSFSGFVFNLFTRSSGAEERVKANNSTAAATISSCVSISVTNVRVSSASSLPDSSLSGIWWRGHLSSLTPRSPIIGRQASLPQDRSPSSLYDHFHPTESRATDNRYAPYCLAL